MIVTRGQITEVDFQGCLSEIGALLDNVHVTLATSGITFYTYRADTEQLDLEWMTGVERPGLMTGPAWEPIFKWERPDTLTGEPLKVFCLENEAEYRSYRGEIMEGGLTFRKKATEATFRDRQRKKHKGGDLALVKACLWIKDGRCLRPAAQIFFTFHKQSADEHTFSPQVKETVLDTCRAILQRLARGIPPGTVDRFLAIRMAIDTRFEQFTRKALGRSLSQFCIAKFHRELIELVLQFSHREALQFGGVADFFLLHAERFAWRYYFAESKFSFCKLLIPPDSLTAECIRNGKEFCMSDVAKSSDSTSSRAIAAEPFLDNYSSVKILPITVDGEVRVVLRILWKGQAAFEGSRRDAIRQIRSITTYAVCSYDDWLQRTGIKGALNLFANSPKNHGLAAAYNLLGGAVEVLGANRIVFHHLARQLGESEAIGGSAKITLGSRNKRGQRQGIRVVLVGRDHPRHGARNDGATVSVHKVACKRRDDMIFCFDVLGRDVQTFDPNDDKLNYLLRIYSQKTLKALGNGQEVAGGRRYDLDSNSIFPYLEQRVTLKSHNLSHAHTEVVFPIRSHDRRRMLGIVWIAFDNLQPIGWWQRYFIRDLARFLASAIHESLLRLAVQNFKHMIQNICETALLDLTRVLYRSRIESPFKIYGDPIQKPNTKRSLRRAEEVLNFIGRKSREVGSLIQESTARRLTIQAELSETIKRAWAIASGLACVCGDFREVKSASFFIERVDGFTICYESRELAGLLVPDYAFSLLVNVLSNARKHGQREPFGSWVFKDDGYVHVVCVNGGNCPSTKRLLEASILGRQSMNQRGGVGTALIHHLTVTHDAKWKCVSRQVAEKEFGKIPAPFDRAKTFFEISVPI